MSLINIYIELIKHRIIIYEILIAAPHKDLIPQYLSEKAIYLAYIYSKSINCCYANKISDKNDSFNMKTHSHILMTETYL